MNLKEFVKAMTDKPERVWECLTCGLLHEVEDNPVAGFSDWSGVIVCPNCGANMKKMEVGK